MTHHHDDERFIAPEHERYNAHLIARVDHTADQATFWVRFDGDPVLFDPGQYMTGGVYADAPALVRPRRWCVMLGRYQTAMP